MNDQNVHRERLDLHNSNIDFGTANAGRCGVTHLGTGRVCWLPHRHPGPCKLQRHHQTVGGAAEAVPG